MNHNLPSPIKQFPCPSCGAKVSFNPEVAQLKCEYCGWEDPIPKSNEQIKEQSYEQYLSQRHTQLGTLSQTSLAITCNDCGATVEFDPPKVAGECAFCGSSLVGSPTTADPTIVPEGLIPFKIGRKKARERVKLWIQKLWFAPNELKKLAQMKKIQGIYLPFWTYDAYTTTNYRGERGDYYYTTETYTETNDEGEEETKTREVRHTRWDSTSGQVSRFFDDILISGTRSVEQTKLISLEPWHLKENLVPYESSYLAGFEAEKPQVNMKDGFEAAKQVMAWQIRSDINRDIGGDERRIHDLSTAYSSIAFKQVLLPVWLTAYRYQNETYQVMVNALTGEVQGDRPYSIWKIVLSVLKVIAVMMVVAAIIFMVTVLLS